MYGPLTEQTEAAIKAATHLTTKDLGAVEALRVLARKIDTEDELREAYLAYQLDKSNGEDVKLRSLAIDVNALPTYLKYCDALGLTPAGRTKLDGKPSGDKPAGKLASLKLA